MYRSTSSLMLSFAPLALFMACAPADSGDSGAADTSADAVAVDTAAEADAILALERQWSDKFAEDDVDWIMNLHAADAVQLPPNDALVKGREALRQAWTGMANTEGLSAEWEPTAAFVSPDGQMAYDYGTATLTLPDGTAIPHKYLVVWVRENGEWKVAADMFNANVAP